MVRRIVPPPTPVEPGGAMRPATLADKPFVGQLATQVFDYLGQYGLFLPRYLDHPSIFSTIFQKEDRPVAFSMLALARCRPRSQPQGPAAPPQGSLWPTYLRKLDPQLTEDLAVELVAIAVQPEAQKQGVGRRLMEHALNFAQAWHAVSAVQTLELNVAETNRQGLAFFQRWGFVVTVPFDGHYPKGQRSIRMAYHLGTKEGTASSGGPRTAKP